MLALVTIVLSVSPNILPKSTGADDGELDQGTCAEGDAGEPSVEPDSEPGWPGAFEAAGEPGSTGEMRELDVEPDVREPGCCGAPGGDDEFGCPLS